MTWPEAEKNREGKAKRHYEVSTKKQYDSTLRLPIIPQEPIDPGLYQFIADYYNKEPQKRITWKGKDFTEKTARIEQKKLGNEWSIEKSPYSDGRFILTKIEQKIPLDDYIREYRNDLKIIYDQQKKKGLL